MEIRIVYVYEREREKASNIVCIRVLRHQKKHTHSHTQTLEKCLPTTNLRECLARRRDALDSLRRQTGSRLDGGRRLLRGEKETESAESAQSTQIAECR